VRRYGEAILVSTKLTGDAAIAAEAVAQAKEMLAEAAGEEEQLSLLDTPTPEEMAEAREALGPEAGRLAVLRAARERKRGRPPGSTNKRTDDFAKYLLSFGPHPAKTMMEIQGTPPEVLIEASQQERVHSFRKDGTPNVVIERLSYEQAQSLRIRCAESLLPYVESKRPVAIDARIVGVRVIEEMPVARDPVRDLLEGEFVRVAGDELGEAP
jgi:hypothetical protein